MELDQHRIAVTGGTGFLGRHVLAELSEVGVPDEQVMVPQHEDYDLTKEADVQLMYCDLKPTVVIHLAAEVGGIGANLNNPGRYFYSNLAMGMHLIELARQNNIAKFVQVGTVCAYPKFTPVPFKESDIWAGYPEETNAPYGVAKKALLVMLQAYRQQYGLNGIYLLPTNLYGPWDNFNPESSHVIPALIRKFHEARQNKKTSVDVWGTGTSSREFLHVADAARGIVMATKAYDSPEPVNLGSGMEVTIRELVESISANIGYVGELNWDVSKPDGQPRRCLDTSLAEKQFGFKAKVSFEDGIKQTIDWWIKNSCELIDRAETRSSCR